MKISVIMPVYNGEKYLNEAIDSILNQTFLDFELIIINDCSTDRTEEIIKSYYDERIVYIKNEKNLGVAESLNRGLELAKGEYIARMDADDISLPDRFKKQVTYMDAHPDCIMCGSNTELFGAISGRSYVPLTDSDIRASMLFSSPFTHPTVIMRRSMIIQNGLKYDKCYEGIEDYELWVSMADIENVSFHNFEEALLKYRVHPQQVTQKEMTAQKKNAFEKLYERVYFQSGIGDIKHYPNIYNFLIDKETKMEYASTESFCKEVKELLESCPEKYFKLVKSVFVNECFNRLKFLSVKQILSLCKEYIDICVPTIKMKLKLLIYLCFRQKQIFQ